MSSSNSAKRAAPGFEALGIKNVQTVLREDGDSARQPPAYKFTSNQTVKSDPIAFDRYLSKDFFDKEMSRMWLRTWQWACREEHIPNPGDYYVYDIGAHSLIVVRTESGAIKAYYNACLHRGTKLKQSFSEGNAGAIACPFHGWTWSLDGKLVDRPCEWDFAKFTREDANLPQARVGVWGGFVFVNFDDNAMPLEDYIAPLQTYADHSMLDQRYVTLHVQKELACNWKVAQEAFIESYHGIVTHPGSGHATSVYSTQYDVFGDHLSRSFTNLARADESVPDVTEQEMLEMAVLGGKLSRDKSLMVPEGGSARRVMADYSKALFKNSVVDFTDRSISEMIDVVGYVLFPNAYFSMSPTLGSIHRIRPLGMDHEKSIFELMTLTPVPKSGRPEPAEAIRLGLHEGYTSVPGMNERLAMIYDQDTGNMVWQQEGMAAAKITEARWADYQETLIKRFHEVLDKYMAD